MLSSSVAPLVMNSLGRSGVQHCKDDGEAKAMVSLHGVEHTVHICHLPSGSWQGDVKEKVPTFLIDKYKIPKKYIDVKK